MKLFIIPFLLLIIVLAATAKLASCYPSSSTSIFILAGQSNMAGRGGVINYVWNGVVPPECQPNPSILRLTAGLSWVEAQEPLHFDIDAKTCGVGPGMPFANTLLQWAREIGVIGLVPCAVGGTSISEWARGGTLYDQMMKRTNAALQSGGIIQAMLGYQGESETQLYKGKLENFFNNVRNDLQLPTLPIIQVALAMGPGVYLETVREAQLGVKLPNVM